MWYVFYNRSNIKLYYIYGNLWFSIGFIKFDGIAKNAGAPNKMMKR